MGVSLNILLSVKNSVSYNMSFEMTVKAWVDGYEGYFE